ncbi:MAG: DUF1858 domain-containing protein [Candidatus Aenigmatarchaeota archaeon]
MIKMKKEKITKNMILGEVVRKYPETVNVFIKHGLPCAMCNIAFSESIEQGAISHGINLSKLLKDLNNSIKKK